MFGGLLNIRKLTVDVNEKSLKHAYGINLNKNVVIIKTIKVQNKSKELCKDLRHLGGHIIIFFAFKIGLKQLANISTHSP